MNNLSVNDHLYNPYDQQTADINYLIFSDEWASDYPKAKSDDPFIYEVHFRIDTTKHMYERTRYNYWDALGDIGGFHDGLLLVFSMFMSTISAASFTNKLVRGAFHFPYNKSEM